MIKTIKAILAPAVITASLLSCKKDNTGNTEPSLIKSEAVKVQTWFGSQPNISAAKIPAANALYANTISYAGSGINITPMQLAGNTTSQVVNKFLVTDIDAAGKITGGSFYIVLNKTNSSLANLATPGFLLLKQIPESFTGGIIKYDMAGNMLNSIHIEAGKVMNGQQDILSATKLKPAGGSTTNLAPPPSGQTCTDWYWQHFENGILIWEEYLYTTCEDGTTGGGGGSNPNTACIQAAEAFVNEGSTVSQLISSSTESETTFQKVDTYEWIFFTAAMWKIKSWERITWTRPNRNLAWTYSSYVSLGDSEYGTSVGGTRTYKIINKTATSYVSSAVVEIIFSVTNAPQACAGIPYTLPPATFTYNANLHCIPKGVTVLPNS